MANRIFTGATDTVWETDANWDTTHPAAGDTAIFNGDTNNSVAGGLTVTDEDITIHTDRRYSGNIGSSGAPLDLRVNKMIHEGIGTVWFNSDAGTNEFSDVVVINSANQVNAATLGGDEIARIIVVSGNVTISGALVHDFELYVVGSNAIVTVETGAGGTAATSGAAAGLNLVQTAGQVTSNINWANATVTGGSFVHSVTALTNFTCLGGTCDLNYRDQSGAEISGDLTVAGIGVVDLTRNNAGTFGITGDLNVIGGGTLRYIDGQLTVSGNQTVAAGRLLPV